MLEVTGERLLPDRQRGELVHAQHLARYRFAAQFARGRRVLDAACGSGRYLRELVARGAAPCIGVDLVAPMLARARAGPALVAQGELRALPLLSGSVDVVVCGLAVGHVADLGSAIDEMARVLRPGGTLVYSDVHPRGARAGWRRTFRVDGRTYAIRHHVHELDDHRRACRSAGLDVEQVSEPAVEVAGPWLGTPAALVVRARRCVISECGALRSAPDRR
jgi:malonyl-CoA O-methyltransferase